jgi:hypothetical protein
MPLDLATLRNDKAFDALTAAILDRDQPRTTDLFYKMVADEGRSVGEALSVVTAAEAPFVQVPNHINVKDGQVVLVNNDHTILGLRASADLMPYLRSSIACCLCCKAFGISPPASTSGTSFSAGTRAAMRR